MASAAIPAAYRYGSGTRPTWAEVSLATLQRNFALLCRWVGGNVVVCAMIKGDAYGHGLVECARALQRQGAEWFGVTSVDDAVLLRNAGIDDRILLITGFCPGEEEEVLRRCLTPVVWEPWHIEALERTAVRLGVFRQPVHLKVDTGMNRLGIQLAGLEQIIQQLQLAPRLFLEGVLTHLADAECLEGGSLAQQTSRFARACRRVEDSGFKPTFMHMANSCAVIAHRRTWKNMVRPGLAIYGYHFSFTRGGQEEDGIPRPAVMPALSWKTRVASLRQVPRGQPLGYNGTFVTQVPSRIAVLPVGYADGLNRQLSSRGRVIVRGSYAPIVGKITMDLSLVDVSHLPGVSLGDEVVLLGTSGGISVDAREHAALAGTIPQEILCNISKRVPRLYTELA